MSVRAKFKVISKTEAGTTLTGGEFVHEGGTVRLEPVYAGSPENEQFYRWTPGGAILLSTVNVAAFNAFHEGAEYYVDFTPAGGAK
jgi:hypothetical protein